MKPKQQLKITANDYRKIFEFAHIQYLEKAKNDLSDGEFNARCYFLAAIRFLNTKGIEINIEEEIQRNTETID